MYVEINEEHIANGKPEDGDACAVAIAIFERTGKKVCVTEDEINWKRFGIETPLCVRDWIRAFDSGEKVEPFGFELDPSLFGEVK